MSLSFVTPIPRPDKPPVRYQEFQHWVRDNQAELSNLSDDCIIARFAEFDIDCGLYIRYAEECERRESVGLPPEHYAPGYASPLRYKQRYIKSPTDFEAMVNHKRAMRRRSREQHEEDKRRKDRERDIAKQARQAAQRERQQERDQEKEIARKRAIRNIKRWHSQGLSVQQISLKIKGRRKDTLLLIRETIKGIRTPKNKQ